MTEESDAGGIVGGVGKLDEECVPEKFDIGGENLLR